MTARSSPPFTALRAIEAAVRHRSYTWAAKELEVTHSAVSQSIKRLEGELGTKLFERRGSAMEPSQAAMQLAQAYADAESVLSRSLEQISQAPLPDRITLAMSPSFGRPFFRARFERETKADKSPVTEADRAAEAAIRAILAVERPTDGIIGEEYGNEREDAARVWVLDPIDGTRAFVAGRPLFGTLIALVEDGHPVLGVIDQPIARDRWLGAAGRPTTLNGAPAQVRRCASIGNAHVGTTSPAAFPGSDLALFQKVGAAAGDTLWGGDCHNYGLVASGHLDAVIESGLKLYDFAALIPVVEGAGGRMTDWQGRPLDANSPGQVIAAGDPALTDQIVELLN